MKLIKADMDKVILEMSQEDYGAITSVMEYASDQYHTLDPQLFGGYTKEQLETVSDKLQELIYDIVGETRGEKIAEGLKTTSDYILKTMKGE